MTSDFDPVVTWYRRQARDLPWRATDRTPWQVLVSEVMLQQTPVNRVLPVYLSWIGRWPTPADLAGATRGDAISAWGRLGYPRRALRLHAAAVTCTQDYGGTVPSDLHDLRALPGVGEYTAAAVGAFAFGQRTAVLDTNVRRVHARVLDGHAFANGGSPPVAERVRAQDLLPQDGRAAAEVSVAVMELGALICTARTPGCARCPIVDRCAWTAAGQPPWQGLPRKAQTYVGTDRQCRGRVLAALREATEPLARRQLATCWHDDDQLDRALAGLAADGLLVIDSSRDRAPSPLYELPR